jgi:hypothetical protein
VFSFFFLLFLFYFTITNFIFCSIWEDIVGEPFRPDYDLREIDFARAVPELSEFDIEQYEPGEGLALPVEPGAEHEDSDVSV